MTSAQYSTPSPDPRPSTAAIADAYGSLVISVFDAMSKADRAKAIKRLGKLAVRFNHYANDHRAKAREWSAYPPNVTPLRGPPMSQRAREQVAYNHEWADRLDRRADAMRYLVAELAEQYL